MLRYDWPIAPPFLLVSGTLATFRRDGGRRNVGGVSDINWEISVRLDRHLESLGFARKPRLGRGKVF